MKTVISTFAAAVLILAPAAWTAANAQGMGEPQAKGSIHSETSAWGHPGKASAVDRTIHIKAEDSMRFVPAKLTVKAGETVKFVITNVGKLKHELVLGPKSEQREHEKEMQEMMHSSKMGMMHSGKMQEMHSGKMNMMHSDPNEVTLPPGKTQTLIWTFTKPGTYQYACHEPGHYAAGMYGTLTVTSAH
ncbi:MAG: cupredoxin domain-containing protein [Gammaproteobacteria bacterium]